jgi:hypothetical protein
VASCLVQGIFASDINAQSVFHAAVDQKHQSVLEKEKRGLMTSERSLEEQVKKEGKNRKKRA